MALCHFAFCKLANPGTGQELAGVDSTVASEGIAVSASNQQTTQTAPLIGEPVFCRVATDTACYVAFGASPNAQTAASRWFLPANTGLWIQVDPGDKGACST